LSYASAGTIVVALTRGRHPLEYLLF